MESRDQVAMRISRALEVIDADKLIVNPDCGLRHVSPPVARAKLRAMVEGAAMVRNRLLGRSEELVSAGDPAS